MKEQVHPLTDAEAEQLINACNEKLAVEDDDEILNGYYNGVFANYISSLACKIILLYGTKNNVINELKITDYNEQLNKLKINVGKSTFPPVLKSCTPNQPQKTGNAIGYT